MSLLTMQMEITWISGASVQLTTLNYILNVPQEYDYSYSRITSASEFIILFYLFICIC